MKTGPNKLLYWKHVVNKSMNYEKGLERLQVLTGFAEV